MSKIGVIGLGTMGAPMARNLLNAGHEIFFFARRESVVDQFRQAGASPCSTCAEVAEAAELIVTIVPADSDVEQVVFGRDGIVDGSSPGKLLIDMSTISPTTVHQIAGRLEAVGVSMLDAPVSGGPSGAERGALSIMVGGNQDDFIRARPMLEVLGEKIFFLGPLASGQTTKLVNQMLAGGVMTLIGEALSVAKTADLDLSQVIEVISASSGNSTVFSARAKFVLENQYVPGFKTELMRKDIALSLALAHELNVPAPVTAVALQAYTAAVQRGDSALDFSAVAKRG